MMKFAACHSSDRPRTGVGEGLLPCSPGVKLAWVALRARGPGLFNEGHMDLKRKARERQIAEEIANEIYHELGPVAPEALALAKNSDIVCKVFSDAFDRHRITNEASAARILKHVPKILAGLNESFANLNQKLDAAIQQQRAEGSIS
jgi:hypothetical protein